MTGLTYEALKIALKEANRYISKAKTVKGANVAACVEYLRAAKIAVVGLEDEADEILIEAKQVSQFFWDYKDKRAALSKRIDEYLNRNTDWEKAIFVFRTRIYGRFIDAADVLVSLDEKKPIGERRFGFAILAIDCAVVETMGAFQEGLTKTNGKSKDTFAKFLSTSPGFQKHFTLARAKKFYTDFRCGILHQAERGWREQSLVPRGTDPGRCGSFDRQPHEIS